jgi:hypothetical protein
MELLILVVVVEEEAAAELQPLVAQVPQESSSLDTQSNNDRIETNLGESWQV